MHSVCGMVKHLLIDLSFSISILLQLIYFPLLTDENDLTGSIPPEFGMMKNLTELSLGECHDECHDVVDIVFSQHGCSGKLIAE